MSQDDLAYLSATDALEMFRARKLSPVEVLKAQIDRAADVEPVINAFSETFYDTALDAAKASEERYGKTDATLGALDGLTCVIKDEIAVEGMPHTGGSLIYKDRIASETDVFPQRLLDAGVIVHARTTTPEFCILGTTHSRLWGVTRNPHNPEFTPGGSSGGTGASLAAGTTTLGTGTDIGGSIRIPASCCGVVGLKAAYGRIPEAAVFNLDFYSHCGPMARTVADTALMFNQVTGASPRDIASLREPMQVPLEPEGISGWKVAYSLDMGWFELDPDVRANTLAAVDALRNLGCTVTEVDAVWNQRADRGTMDYLNFLWGQHMKRLYPEHRDLMTDYAIRTVEQVEKTTAEDFLQSLEVAHETYRTFGTMMEDYDVFLCPTNAVPAVAAEHDSWDQSFEINGRRMDAEYGWVMTHPFNMMSRCPVLSVPSGIASSGVPTGVQVVGKTYDEPAVFRAAAALETAFGFQQPGPLAQKG